MESKIGILVIGVGHGVSEVDIKVHAAVSEISNIVYADKMLDIIHDNMIP